MEWDKYFVNIAHQVKMRSKDENTRIGVVIVGKGKEIISTGYNSFPRGIDDEVKERQKREGGEKYFWMAHAETNAIVNCARSGVSTLDTMMYMTCGLPCADCTRNIINAGIVSIWCKESDFSQPKWEESCRRSLQMFKEANVKINYY